MSKLQKHRVSEDALTFVSGNLEIHRNRRSTFTPYKYEGIWELPSYTDEVRTVIVNGGLDGDVVCRFSDSLSGEEAEKYARIFAAGPKMLAALTACHDIIHDLVAENIDDPSVGIVKDPEIDKAYLSLYAAIVEATNNPDHVKSFVLGHIQS